MTLSHEKAVKSAFSICPYLFKSPDPRPYLKVSVYVPSLELRFSMKSITVPTLSKTTLPEPILEHEIRLRAYKLYAQRGMAEGHALQDWLYAEAELLYSH